MDKFSRHITDFNIAGFTYWDGIDVIDKLAVGTILKLELDDANPYDPRAVALTYKNKKIGYVPRTHNLEISQALYYGHDVFEAIITQFIPEAHPERQVRVMVRIADNRSSK
ncbi:MAG: HIRAN domain-containing protein [Raoultibacter sp.]|jgi:hypothetical protein